MDYVVTIWSEVTRKKHILWCWRVTVPGESGRKGIGRGICNTYPDATRAANQIVIAHYKKSKAK